VPLLGAAAPLALTPVLIGIAALQRGRLLSQLPRATVVIDGKAIPLLLYLCLATHDFRIGRLASNLENVSVSRIKRLLLSDRQGFDQGASFRNQGVGFFVAAVRMSGLGTLNCRDSLTNFLEPLGNHDDENDTI